MYFNNTQTSWVRLNGVLWADMQPTAPTGGVANINWNAPSFLAVQDQIALMSSRGITPIVIIRKTPGWAQAQPGYSCGPILSSRLGDFGNFLRGLTARLKEAPYNVKYYAIWNEPDVDYRFRTSDPNGVLGCWGNWDEAYYGGQRYATMLKVAHDQIKLVDPQAKVIIGGLLLPCAPANITPGNVYCGMSKFFEGVLKEMRDSYGTFAFDGVAFNAYDYYDDVDEASGLYWNRDWNTFGTTSGVVAVAKAQYLKSLMAQYGATGKGVFNTESALVCQYETNSQWCQAKNPAKPYSASLREDYEIAKAFYVPKVFSQMLAEGVDATIWYNLKNNSPDTPPSWFLSWTTGLVRYDGTPQFAYTAYKYASQQLGKASFVKRITSFPNAFIYEFARPGRRVWVGWSEVSGGTPITFTTVPSAITNGFYTLPPPSTSFTLNTQPVYVEWAVPAAMQTEVLGPPAPDR